MTVMLRVKFTLVGRGNSVGLGTKVVPLAPLNGDQEQFQVGSLAGAAHLLKDNASVQRQAQ